jgi:hypothetical protein
MAGRCADMGAGTGIATAAGPQAARADRRPAVVLLPVLLCTLGLLYAAALHPHLAPHHRTPAAVAAVAVADTHSSTVRADLDATQAAAAATPAAARYFARISDAPVTLAVAPLGPARTRGPPAGLG